MPRRGQLRGVDPFFKCLHQRARRLGLSEALVVEGHQRGRRVEASRSDGFDLGVGATRPLQQGQPRLFDALSLPHHVDFIDGQVDCWASYQPLRWPRAAWSRAFARLTCSRLHTAEASSACRVSCALSNS